MTDLAIDLAHDLAGVADIPEKLGALLHYDPHVEANVDIGTGASDYRPVVGSQTLDVLSQPTPSNQPTYGVSPTFASGRRTLQFSRAASQSLFNESMASLAVFNGVSPWTMCLTCTFDDVTKGGSFATIYPSGETTTYISPYNAAATPGQYAVRYRSTLDGLTTKTVAAPDAAVDGVPLWVIIDFDGVDTVGIQTAASGVRLTAGGGGDTNPTGLDSLSIGDGFLNVPGGELGDLAIFTELDAAGRAAMIAWMEARL